MGSLFAFRGGRSFSAFTGVFAFSAFTAFEMIVKDVKLPTVTNKPTSDVVRTIQ